MPLLRNFEPKILKSLLINKRFVGVSLFKIDKIIFEQWKRQFIYCPSEILILNKNFPNLSRISFPDHLFLNNNQYLMLEFSSKSEQFISENQINEIALWLNDIFKTEAYFCDSRLMIYGYNPPLENYTKVEQEFDKIRNNLPVHVPFSYWWPINTSHAVDAATKCAKDFKNMFFRSN